MLTKKTLASLYNGVSQQPATLRLPSQWEENVNVYPTVVDGPRKRPPSEHVVKVTSANLNGAYLHTINRDASERYEVVVTDGQIQVFDMAGNPKTVTYQGRGAFQSGHAYNTLGATIRVPERPGVLFKVTQIGTSAGAPAWPSTLGADVTTGGARFTCVPDYLYSTDPKRDFVCITVADYTFVLNRRIVVGLDKVGSDYNIDPDTYYWLNRQIDRGSGIAETLRYVQLRAIQQQYRANYTGVLYKGVKQSLQELADVNPVNGDLWKIQGTEENNFSTYWVVREGSAWNETVEPGLQNKIDACTMPHALVRKADGTFEFAPFSWNSRRVGDDKTNKHPSFVGRMIRDVFFYNNRLGLACGEGAVLSRAGDFGTFHRLTVLDLLPDEVIDIAASETKVTLINHAVPFADTMMLFSDQVQFRVNHGDVLSPTSASIDPATQYTVKVDVNPLPLGSDVYFASEAEGYATIHEYYVKDNSEANDAGNVTAHVPRYIPAGVTKLFGSSTHDFLGVLTDGAPNRIYIYKYHWTSENQKAQSAWGYWEFDAGDVILSADVLSDYVYVFVKRADGTYLERIPLESGAKAPGLPFQVYLDRRVQVTGVYLAFENVTEFALPYIPNYSKLRIVRGAGFGATAGAMVLNTGWTWVNATTVRVPGNVAGSCAVGQTYDQRFVFSEQFMRDRQDNPILTGRLQLRTYTVYFVDTAYFRTEVAPYGVAPDVEEIIPSKLSEFDGKTLGQVDLTGGTPVLSKGSYTFSIWGDSTIAKVAIVNDTPYGFTLQQAEWEGFYFNRT
jgi:hypothetical protein